MKTYQHSEEAKRKMSIAHTGLHHTEETKKKISINSAMRGKKMPEELKQKLIKINTGKKRPYAKPPHEKEEKSSHWKGEEVGPSGARQWIVRHFGKATKCENIDCHYPRRNANNVLLLKPKSFTWTSVSGQCFRDKEDWFQLCASCNRKYHGQ